MIAWAAPPSGVVLQAASVHVWAWDDACSAEDVRWYQALLSPEEQVRVDRFLREQDRVRYVVNHGVMRCLLGQYLGVAPQSLRFDWNEYGKPRVVPPDLQFSLSHSGGMALLAVAADSVVGVDVEQIRPIAEDVAERFFSPEEQSALRGLPDADWLGGFYRCWTRKEAVLKADGVGLHRALDSFTVSLSSSAEAAILAVQPEVPFSANWRLVHLAPAAGFVAALAVDAWPVEVCCYRFGALGGPEGASSG